LETIEDLEAEIAALDEQNRSLTALNRNLESATLSDGTGPSVGGNGDRSQATTSVALRAANEQIAALEAELEATARLAAEFAPETALPDPTPSPANGPRAADETELAAALERIEDLDAELTTARARLESLQSLLQAEWPGPPRPAPR
jgi:hypothetical protein